MFYITELKYKIFYLVNTFLFLLSIMYYYKQNLFLLISYTIIKSYTLISFFYTHPIELIKIYFLIIFFFNIFFFMPIFIFTLFDYLKSSLYLFKLNEIKINLYLLMIFIYSYNSFILFFLLPNLWYILEKINNTFLLSQFILTFLELKLDEYFYFIFFYIFFLNFFFIINLILFIILFFFYKLKSLKYKNYHYYWIIFLMTCFLPLDGIILILTFIYFFLCIELFVVKYIIFTKILYFNLNF